MANTDVPMRKQAQPPQAESMPRLFQNRILDAIFSQGHFSTPMLIWLPVVCILIYRGIWITDAPVLPFLGIFLLGVALWTFFEYALHRWMLHWIPNNSWGQKLHFWLHGIHHDFPQDTRVVPPGRSVPGAALLGLVFYFTFGAVYWQAIFGGFMLGYVGYETIHYAIHNAKLKNKWFLKLQKHHMYHHFRNHDSAFGFSGTFWDWVFKTRFEDIGDPEEH